jgi:hypothetical protein
MKTRSPPVLITFTFVCLAFVQNMHAVTPAPDGGYPGGNTAEGQNALLSLTTGGYNTANGWLSLRSNTTGQLNTAIGAGALLANTADNNTATGAGALLSNTTGAQNTAHGAFALFSNTTGEQNTANGLSTLFSNTTGSQNSAFGHGALANNTSGGGNTGIGLIALSSNTTGTVNTAIGTNALGNNDGGNANTAIGQFALGNNINGSNNIALGSTSGTGVTSANHTICIGADGNNVDNSCYIGNIFGSTSSNGVAVLVNSDGRLGTMTSSARFKDEIKPMDKASEALFALKPVAFRYKRDIDPAGTPQLGLVAEDVEKVNPDLIVRDKEGKAYSVRYDQVNAMLLNEFLKEHKKVQNLEVTVAQQQKGMEVLTAQLKEQAAQIQKVSAQLEVNKPAAKVVVNKP